MHYLSNRSSCSYHVVEAAAANRRLICEEPVHAPRNLADSESAEPVQVLPIPSWTALLPSVLILILFSLCSPGFSKADPHLKIGVYQNSPLIFNHSDGTADGLFPELLNEIARDEGWKLTYVASDWDSLLEQLDHGQIDLLPVIAFSEQRAKRFNFSDETVLVNWAEIYTSKGTPIHSLLDLEGQRVGVKMNDIHLAALQRLTKQFGITCRFVESDGYQTIFEMLDARYLDIGVVNRFFGQGNKRHYQVKSSPIIFNPIELRFAAPKNKHQFLLSQLDLRLKRYKDEPDSIYHQAIARWLGAEKPAAYPLYAWYLIGGLATGLLLLGGVTVLLRHQVRKRTSDLQTSNEKLLQEVKQRQETMQELKKYAKIVESGIDANALCDPEHRHLLVNAAYLALLDVSREETKGKSLVEVFGEDYFELHLKEPILRSLSGKQTNFIASLAKPGRPLRHLHFHLGPYLTGEQQVAGYFVDIRNITQQVELEEKLKQAQKMEAIGLLAGGVAHDLNNILSGLVSYPDMLLVNREADDPMHRPLTTIKKSGERAAAIVSDLLTLARRGVDNLQVANLNLLISEFLQSPEYETIRQQSTGVKLELQLLEELLNLQCSPIHLTKSLMNLIQNAFDAMPNGGLLTITTTNLYLEGEQSGLQAGEDREYVVLTITDTGIGMDEEKIGHIFEPFYTSKVMGRSGTGLGMTLVWNAVKDHRGHIEVDSTPDKGSTFTLYFPATRESLPLRNSQELSRFLGKGQMLLVVDDVEEQRTLANDLLTMLGYRVATAASGEEAVRMAEAQNYDLLLLDMIMPGGMDGLATYQEILKISPKQKAIIASGFSDAANLRRTQKLGAGHYVRKPYTVLTLAMAVHNELQSKEREIPVSD